MRIRDIRAEDRELVLKMVERFYASRNVVRNIPPKHYDEAFDELSEGGSQRLRGLLIEIDDQIAGFCTLSFTYSIEAGGVVVLIEDVYVKREFRGQGAGHAVIDFVRDEYHDKAVRLRLEVNPQNSRAIALYEKLDFRRLPYIQMVSEDF